MMNWKQTSGGGPGRGTGLSQGAVDAHGRDDSLGTQGEDHPAAGQGSTPPAERLQRRHSHAYLQQVPVRLQAVFGGGDPEKKDFVYRSISIDNELHHSTSDEPMKLTYDKIKEITNGLDKEQIVGIGAFGTVYKGVYENGEEIAVKILRNMSGFDCKEFLKEFRNLRSLKHENVVELVGFCNEMEEVLTEHEGKQVLATKIHTALCFQYVNNGSLQKHISDESTGLNWPERYKIIKGICQGLKYLREGLESPVLHLDLKPDNILLDQEMVPKIADFGLSRLLGEENTRRTISSVGTLGYLPPEYIELQVISEAFDIFSLGVIITKIVTGHEGYNNIADMTPTKFVKQIHDKWRKRLVKILKPRPLEVYCHQVKKCVEIALGCIRRNRQDRPTIQLILSTLLETEMMVQNLGADQFVDQGSIVTGRCIPDKQLPVIADQFSKTQCQRVCPEVSTFTHVEVCRSSSGSRTNHDNDDVSSSTTANSLGRDHAVYTHLARGLLSPYLARDCITQCIGASSTDSFPRETIKNTLEPVDRVGMRPSYWSSRGHRDTAGHEYLLYRLQADLCLVDKVKVQPFKAFFQGGNQVYSAKCIRFQMGYPRSPLQPETLVCDDNEGQLIDDRNYVWTYTSPEFPMLQQNMLQSFKLPRPVLCIGGVVKVELLGGVEKQASDGLYYICMSHVQIMGMPLSRELGVVPGVKGVVLTYYPVLVYPVLDDMCSKTQCLRVCPEVSIFDHVEMCGNRSPSQAHHDQDDVLSSTRAERLDTDNIVYTHLALDLLTPYTTRDCIIQCIGASSTDSFPRETINNTLEPVDCLEMRPSYWSSRGHRLPVAQECLIYRLQADLCLVDEVKVQPFKAFFQGGNPIYSAKCIRFKMGYPRSPLRPETLVSGENEGQLIDDGNYVWTYTSPEFPMLQQNMLQSFKLPHPVLCIGGVVKVELLGGVEKQVSDGLYYICMSHVQIMGMPLSRELGVVPGVKGVVLTYYPDLVYPVLDDMCSKTQCLRVCPEVSIFDHVEMCGNRSPSQAHHDQDDVLSSTRAERLDTDNIVYTHLALDLLTPYTARDCIIQCIGASSTDSFPRETINNTLEPVDCLEMRPSYWSSRGHRLPVAQECLIYRLQADLCLVDEVKVQPFKAFFQGGNPIYSAKCIRFKMGYPRSPLRPETLVSGENEGQLIDDGNYVWTYTSPEFPMLQKNILQSFKLPRPTLCIGGVVKIELVGGVQQQKLDGLYYICMSFVQIMGKPLSRELGVAPRGKGVVLSYYPDLGHRRLQGFTSRFSLSGMT
ncbi:hypothetical protein QYE76_040951 [Lolium multiflorum]|uniref:Protein kinase domain-containing protein n=1 Tax=Lolium multiflorum TaxID=4521 RepID=A0AAD8WVX6_LOLMU|nr:hypothetical protein QYE76_040951 [Lolium multiflorum]